MARAREGGMPGVALIEPVGGHGGMNFYDFALAAGLTHAGHEVVLYTCDATQAPFGSDFDLVPAFRGIYGSAPRWRRALRFVAGLLRSLRSARQRGLEVAHFHFFHSTPLEWASVALARLAGLAVVITAHDVESFAGEGSRGLGRRLYGLADAVIAHNRVSAAELEQALRLPAERVSVISSGNYRDVATTAPPRVRARESLGVDAGAVLVLFFGQIKKVKGLDLLLEAFPAVCREDESVRLLIAGKVWKDDFGRYRSLIDAGGAAERIVTDIRFVPDGEIGLYYAAADVVVLPYRKIYQSAVLLMALSHGRAVLVSDLPGMTEVVDHDETGYVFRSGDVADLADKLRRLCADAALRERLGYAARRLMEDRYGWNRVGEAVSAVYMEALGR